MVIALMKSTPAKLPLLQLSILFSCFPPKRSLEIKLYNHSLILSSELKYDCFAFAENGYNTLRGDLAVSKDDLLFELGNRIYARRKELNMTQKELAEAVNLSIQSISGIELGKKAVRPENLVNICRALDVSSDYLLLGRRDEKQLEPIAEMLSQLGSEDLELLKALIIRLNAR